MPINLVPKAKRGRGMHGEQLDSALLDSGISDVLELWLAIDNQTDDANTLKGWLQAKMNAGETVEYEEMSEIFDGLSGELEGIHAKLTAARKANRGK